MIFGVSQWSVVLTAALPPDRITRFVKDSHD